MKPIRIFRHVDCEGPGYFAEVLRRRDISYEIVAIDEGQAVPEALDDVSALVFMGGPMSVNDELPWISDELALIRRAAARRLPLLGHCLGGQLISKALGGSVGANLVREIGWFGVEQVGNAVAEAWLDGLPTRFEVFHWHGETFSIPEGATCILRNDHCDHQAFVLDNILAMQCHVEMTAELVREWARRYVHELMPSASVQSAAQMVDDLEARIAAMRQSADVLYDRWLERLS